MHGTSKTEEPKLHLCFDFDKTLTKKHIGNSIFPNFLRRTTPDMMKGGEEIGRLFETAISKGHKISIVSYNENTDFIISCLEAVGVSDESIRQIVFICHLARNEHTGKVFHMEMAEKDHGIIGDRRFKTVLIDDNQINIDLAKTQGYLTLRVIVPEDAPKLQPFNQEPKYDLTHLRILGGIVSNPEGAEAILAKHGKNVDKFLAQHKPKPRASNGTTEKAAPTHGRGSDFLTS